MSRRPLAGALPVALLLASAAAFAEAPPVKWVVEAAHSNVSYKVVHPFHETIGKTSTVEGVAVLKPEGGALVQVRVDLRTFDSGNSNRDDHMKECTEANKFPFVTIKGLLKDFHLPATYPADANVTLNGELELHGVKQNLAVPVHLHFDSASHARAQGEFDVSLDGYHIERPSLMMTKISDACHMTVDLAFTGG